MTVVEQFDAALAEPMPPEEDVVAWNVEALRRIAIGLARELYCGFFYVVACQTAAEYDEREFVRDEEGLVRLAQLMAEAKEKFAEKDLALVFPVVRELLKTAGDMYFMLLSAAFPTPKVGTCHLLFWGVVSRLGERETIEHAADLVKERRAMCREINALTYKADVEKGLAAVRDGLGDLGDKVDGLGKDVARFDRRQSNALHEIKRWIKGFIALFRPGAPKLDEQQVMMAMLPPSRYDCLEKVKEPHRSQIKAVIDYTWQKRPIDFKATKNRKDAYTLADAVRDVWRLNHNTWEKTDGTFPSLETLKSACYHFQKSDHDPFCYRTAK